MNFFYLANLALGGLICLAIGKIYYDSRTGGNEDKRNALLLIDDIKKNELSYGKIFGLLMLLRESENLKEFDRLTDIVERSSLSEKSKSYFLEVIAFIERSTFRDSVTYKKCKFKRKHYREILDKIVG